MAEPDEKILIPLQNIAWALLVVRSAHRLLNAVLDDKPKAAIIRELAVELEEFMVTSIGLGDSTNADRFDARSMKLDGAAAYTDARRTGT
jgi:hypothetical protein